VRISGYGRNFRTRHGEEALCRNGFTLDQNQGDWKLLERVTIPVTQGSTLYVVDGQVLAGDLIAEVALARTRKKLPKTWPQIGGEVFFADLAGRKTDRQGNTTTTAQRRFDFIWGSLLATRRTEPCVNGDRVEPGSVLAKLV